MMNRKIFLCLSIAFMLVGYKIGYSASTSSEREKIVLDYQGDREIVGIIDLDDLSSSEIKWEEDSLEFELIGAIKAGFMMMYNTDNGEKKLAKFTMNQQQDLRLDVIFEALFDSNKYSKYNLGWDFSEYAYLEYLFDKGFYFSKKDFGFVKKILDREDLDKKVRSGILALVFSRNSIEDLLEVFPEEDVKNMFFSYLHCFGRMYLLGVLASNSSDKKIKLVLHDMFRGAWVVRASYNTIIEQIDNIFRNTLYEMIDIIETAPKDSYQSKVKYNNEVVSSYDDLKNFAIGVSLELFVRGKYGYKNSYYKDFLQAITLVSKRKSEPKKLKDLTKLILEKIKSKDLDVREGRYPCELKFAFIR